MSKTEMNAKVSAEKKSPTVTVTITAVMVAFVFVVTYFLSADRRRDFRRSRFSALRRGLR